MKILFVTHYALLYGANKSLLDLIDGLTHLGVHATVVMPEYGELCDVLETAHIPYVIQKFEDWVHPPLKYKGSTSSPVVYLKKLRLRWKTTRALSQSLKELEKQLEGESFDIVYSNSSVFNFGFLYAKRHNLPHIWHLREALTHYNLEWTYPVKQVKRMFENSQFVFAISRYVKENIAFDHSKTNIIVEYDSILSSNQLSQIDSAIALKHSSSSSSSSSSSEHLTFGMVALVHPNKGQIEAVKALHIVHKKYPNSKLKIAGGGHTSKLQAEIKSLGLEEHVTLLGQVRDPFSVFLNIDVFLMCSRMEGLGRVTLEAMACSLPIIGYKDGGTAELIEDTVTGLFYEDGAIDLADKMMMLIENPEERQRLARQGRAFITKEFTNEYYAERLYNYMKTVV